LVHRRRAAVGKGGMNKLLAGVPADNGLVRNAALEERADRHAKRIGELRERIETRISQSALKLRYEPGTDARLGGKFLDAEVRGDTKGREPLAEVRQGHWHRERPPPP